MFPEVQLGGSLQIDAPMLGPKQRTLSPAVTGGAILAVKVCYHSEWSPFRRLPLLPIDHVT